ncbi:hypothetical protein R69658_05206 [Paraburkholderia aspalathi]|uniref:Lipoprotein-attachment site-containing protein n=1 Tax=Paraburkholderia aspalathi TaxID=1324617 RepID=A0ABN7MIZ8_9BURK|nr:hypothetical protein R69658_05206 [Paraburkholderia aspalathi]
MRALTSVVLVGCLAWSLAACSSGPSKPALPDGQHRVPVNRILPVPEVPTSVLPTPAAPASQALPVSPGAGARS